MEPLINDSPPILQTPPTAPKIEQYRDWFPLPDSDPVIDYLVKSLWDKEKQPASWMAARLSPAAYIYQEQATGWKILIKFYVSKTGVDAVHHAEREYRLTQQAWQNLGSKESIRSVQPLGLWEGLLFLEFVEGLTLEDKIAIRRSQPGDLLRTIKTAGILLSRLHQNSIQQQFVPDFSKSVNYAQKVVGNLARHGVLQDHPNVQNALLRLFDKWAKDQNMWDFDLVFNHGDATTTNFVNPPGGGLVAIDWERSEFNDPAADLGRLMAEITHSINQHGGNFEEGMAFSQQLEEAYCAEMPSSWNADKLRHRAKFFQATSTLRISRNGWLSHLDRLSLVLQAFGLLTI